MVSNSWQNIDVDMIPNNIKDTVNIYGVVWNLTWSIIYPNLWYLTNTATPWVLYKIDLYSFTIIASISTGNEDTHSVMYWKYLYVSCQASNRVDKIDLETFINVGNVATWDWPVFSWISWEYLYVSCASTGWNRLDKINLITFTNIGNISITSPKWIGISGRYLYLWHWDYNLSEPTYLSKIDLYSFIIVWTISISWTWISIIPNWQYLYVWCSAWTSAKVDKIDLYTFINITNIWTSVLPYSLEIFWEYLYVSCFQTNLQKISLPTFTTTSTLAFSWFPSSITINEYVI